MTGNEENKIHLPEFLCAMLRSGKIIGWMVLVFAVTAGLLTCLLRGLQLADPETLRQAEEYNTISQQRYEAEKESVAMQIEVLRENIVKQQEYLDASLLMHLDPYGFYQKNAVLHIQTDYQIVPEMTYQNPDRTAVIVDAYADGVENQELLQTVAQALNTTSQYAAELITVTTEAGQGVLTVKVRHADPQTTAQILDAVCAHLTGLQTQISQTVEPHTLSVSQQTVMTKVDTSLLERQSAQREKLSGMLTALSSAQVRQDKLEKPEERPTTVWQVLGKAAVFAALGAAAGFAAALLILFAAYGERICSIRHLAVVTGVPTLSGIRITSAKSRVRQLCDCISGCSADPQQFGQLAADIRNRCPQGALVVGGAEVSAVLRQLQDQLPNIRIAGDILTDAEAVESLAQSEKIVLVEQLGKSRCVDVRRRQQMVRDYGKQLIGCVLIDN